jgi:aquaporin Z
MDYRKLGMEAMGTFFLVLVASTGNPLAIGLVLAIMVYLGGNISGGHFNPAVSLAVYLRGKLPMKDLFPYVIAQVSGGLVGALIAYMISHDAPFIQVAGFEDTVGRKWSYIHGAIASEFVFTFLLAFVVLTVATTKKHAGNPYYGLCIGGTVLVAATAVGPISGGAFNPAVGLSKSIIGMFGKPAAIQWFWIYLIFPLLGGYCAALAFNFFHPDEAEPMPKIPMPVKPAPAQAPLEQQPPVAVTPPQS